MHYNFGSVICPCVRKHHQLCVILNCPIYNKNKHKNSQLSLLPKDLIKILCRFLSSSCIYTISYHLSYHYSELNEMYPARLVTYTGRAIIERINYFRPKKNNYNLIDSNPFENRIQFIGSIIRNKYRISNEEEKEKEAKEEKVKEAKMNKMNFNKMNKIQNKKIKTLSKNKTSKANLHAKPHASKSFRRL